MFYKDVAPLALERSAGFSPLQRAMDDDVSVSGDASDSRAVKRRKRRAPVAEQIFQRHLTRPTCSAEIG
jgi:hypothetical protein